VVPDWRNSTAFLASNLSSIRIDDRKPDGMTAKRHESKEIEAEVRLHTLAPV
jgi:hypothetical protein